MDLSGKVVVVRGAESGIGYAIAEAVAAAGGTVVMAGIAVDRLAEAAGRIGTQGRNILAVPVDVRDAAAVEQLFATACEHFGRIDAAVANAGIIGTRKAVTDLAPEDLAEVRTINLTGTFLTLAAAARRLIHQGGGGSLIATGSSTALKPVPGLAPYAASKGGVHALMHTLALELAPWRIRVNTLVPGTTATAATRAMPGYLEEVARTLPLGAVTEPEEIARYAVFALSDAAPHMTGTLLKIDSGRTL